VVEAEVVVVELQVLETRPLLLLLKEIMVEVDLKVHLIMVELAEVALEDQVLQEVLLQEEMVDLVWHLQLQDHL
tara:strand:- start:83 stop:304 length:222 start_codon:yes stop_codon:yes gene_type:complete